ncbi:hypothetical protein ACIA49_34870 [Kribbella sp. NPDC051587]|uniref:hypothetical protein n=1 Tax=Kribbella sp. NPDC051587 TaxID=3364119 RepID=UPI0037B621ED
MIDLEPPSVPPLTQSQHDRLRRNVMTKTRPSSSTAHKWAAPLVAVGAVAAVVAGGVIVVQHTGNQQQPPAAATTPSPKSVAIPAPSMPPQSATILPFPTAVDLGPVPAAEAAQAAKACHVPGSGPGGLQVLWSRRLKGAAPGSRFVQLVVEGEGVRAVCQQGVGVYMIEDTYWAKQPTARHALSTVVGSSWSTQPTKMYFQHWTLYRARADIARVESRYVWPGGASDWVKGAVADGFAYTDSRAIPVSKNPVTPTEEIRAYDAQGQRVPV